MDCFNRIIYCRLYGRFNLFDMNVLTGFMISVFLAAPASRVRRPRNLMSSLFCLGKKYYFIQKLSFLINNLFGKVFKKFFGVIDLITRNSDAKKV